MPASICYAQAQQKVQSIKLDFVPETGEPIAITNSSAELELDPFNAPVAMRVYVTYQNIGTKSVIAVKFRLRLLDSDGKEVGQFLASDSGMVTVNQTGSQRWRKEGINPRTVQLKAVALQAKFDDGSDWRSAQLTDPVQSSSATTDGSVQNQ